LSARGYLFDANAWVALALGHHLFHAQAASIFATATPDRQVCFCSATRISVPRLLTTESVFKPAGLSPMTNRQALMLVDAWLASPVVGVVDEPASVWERWREFVDLPTPSPKRWMDAHLAAFAMETGLQLVTTDGAFSSYAKLDALVLAPPAGTALPAR
jgi:toxin-antitoxin system PIN domain toxin